MGFASLGRVLFSLLTLMVAFWRWLGTDYRHKIITLVCLRGPCSEGTKHACDLGRGARPFNIWMVKLSKKVVFVLHDFRLNKVTPKTLVTAYRNDPRYEIIYFRLQAHTEHLRPADALAEAEKRIKGKELHLMVIHAHGTPGVIQIGNNFVPGTYGAFRTLRPYFAKDAAGIEIHSCNFASWKLDPYSDAPDIRKQFIDYFYRTFAAGTLAAIESNEKYGARILRHIGAAGAHQRLELTDQEKATMARLAIEFNHGRRALVSIAQAANTTAKGGIFTQFPGKDGQIEGPYLIARPNGTVTMRTDVKMPAHLMLNTKEQLLNMYQRVGR